MISQNKSDILPLKRKREENTDCVITIEPEEIPAPTLMTSRHHGKFDCALKVLSQAHEYIRELRRWEKKQQFLPQEVNIFLDIDDTVIFHGSDTEVKNIRYVGGREAWDKNLGRLKNIPRVNVYALTSIGIRADQIPSFNESCVHRASMFLADNFPFSRDKNPSFDHRGLPVPDSTNPFDAIEIYHEGMFFVPTIVDETGCIMENPQGIDLKVNRSKGELLFKEVYQAEKCLDYREPCFIFVDDRKSNCKTVLKEGIDIGIATHTFKVRRPQLRQSDSSDAGNFLSSIFGNIFDGAFPNNHPESAYRSDSEESLSAVVIENGLPPS